MMWVRWCRTAACSMEGCKYWALRRRFKSVLQTCVFILFVYLIFVIIFDDSFVDLVQLFCSRQNNCIRLCIKYICIMIIFLFLFLDRSTQINLYYLASDFFSNVFVADAWNSIVLINNPATKLVNDKNSNADVWNNVFQI